MTTDLVPASAVNVQPGSRLEDLLATYARFKPEADEAAARLKTITDAIKVELTAAAPGAQRIDVAHETLPQPLRLAYIESWRVDTKRLKAEAPETYVRFAIKGGKWDLRGVKA
jgi:hypothetical protein